MKNYMREEEIGGERMRVKEMDVVMKISLK